MTEASEYTLRWEPLQVLLDDGIEELLRNHWVEVAMDKESVPLDPDWERMFILESVGEFAAAALRRNGKLIGYNAFAIYPHVHYKSTMYAFNDVIYVDPAERGIAGVRLVRGVEPMLKALGVKKVIYHTKVHVHVGHNDGLVGDLLNCLGYKHFENLYCKLIG